jgi:Asp-tRNA(Asn)/Glu-tRNA(Gln) amidotransferase C subunit
MFDELNNRRLELTLDVNGADEIVYINEEILLLQQQIRENIGSQAAELDLVNGNYEEQLQLLRDIRAERLREDLEAARSAKILAEQSQPNINRQLSERDFSRRINRQFRDAGVGNQWVPASEHYSWGALLGAEHELEFLREWRTQLNDAAIAGNDVSDALSLVTARIAHITDAQNEHNAHLESTKRNYENLTQEIYKLENGIDDIANALDVLNNVEIDPMQQVLAMRDDFRKQVSLTFREWNAAQSEVEKSFIESSINETMREWLKSIEEIENTAARAEAFKAYEKTAGELEIALGKLPSAVEQAQASINSFASAYSTLSNALEEYKEYGNLEIQTVIRLIDLGEDYLSMLEFTENGIILNANATELLIEARRVEAIAANRSAMAEQIRTIAANDGVEATQNATTQSQNLSIASSNLGESLMNVAQDYGTAAAMAQLYNENIENINWDSVREEIQKTIDMFMGFENLILDSDFTRNATNSRSGRGSSSDPHLDEANRQIAELRFLRDRQLISEQTYYNRLADINRNFFEGRAKYLDNWRSLELETARGIQQNWETNMRLQLQRASRNLNIDEQVRILEELQADIHAQANRWRELGYDNSANEIRELRRAWSEAQE